MKSENNDVKKNVSKVRQFVLCIVHVIYAYIKFILSCDVSQV